MISLYKDPKVNYLWIDLFSRWGHITGSALRMYMYLLVAIIQLTIGSWWRESGIYSQWRAHMDRKCNMTYRDHQLRAPWAWDEERTLAALWSLDDDKESVWERPEKKWQWLQSFPCKSSETGLLASWAPSVWESVPSVTSWYVVISLPRHDSALPKYSSHTEDLQVLF